MSITTLWILELALIIIVLLFVSIRKELKRPKHMDTKVEPRDPPKFSGVILSNSYPHGTLVKVVTPDDPTFKSPWDGLTGIVVGVAEDYEWYNVMFPLDGHMKFQVFRRHDLERVDRAQ